MNMQSVMVLAVLGIWAAAAAFCAVRGKRRGCCKDCTQCAKKKECRL